MPTLSVIVPNYNHSRYLPRRIESVLRQTYQDFELILLDDCSTDESRSILSRYANGSRVRTEFNAVNSGSPFRQWNKGVRLARGKYVWIAESDDYADDKFIETVLSELDRDARVVFAYCRSRCVSDDESIGDFGDYYLRSIDPTKWTADFCTEGKQELANYFPFGNPVPNASSVIFRRADYEAAGGADETFRLCGDWKLWAALALRGKMAYVAIPLNYWRYHSSSVRASVSRPASVAEYVKTVRWILGQAGPVPNLSAICDKYAEYWIPVVLDRQVPLNLRMAIARDVLAMDPHAIRRAIWPGLTAVRLKLKRHLFGARAA